MVQTAFNVQCDGISGLSPFQMSESDAIGARFPGPEEKPREEGATLDDSRTWCELTVLEGQKSSADASLNTGTMGPCEESMRALEGEGRPVP